MNGATQFGVWATRLVEFVGILPHSASLRVRMTAKKLRTTLSAKEEAIAGPPLREG
jgi:hypothetical protein